MKYARNATSSWVKPPFFGPAIGFCDGETFFAVRFGLSAGFVTPAIGGGGAGLVCADGTARDALATFGFVARFG
jgi:hypothetical protein